MSTKRVSLLLLASIFMAARPLGAGLPRDGSSGRTLAGSIPAAFSSAQTLAPADPDLPLERIILVLNPRDPRELESFLARQQDPSSPDFHRWLTPAEFGLRFGARQDDLDALTTWLGSEGFDVEGPTIGRTALIFSGRLGQVERAFQTRIVNVVRNGRPHTSNEIAPTVPSRLARSVAGILSLDDFPKRKPFAVAKPLTGPLYTNGSSHYLAPADFSAIYNVDPLYSAGIDGAGRTIGIPSRSNVNLENTRTFRTFFGLAANDPVVVLNGDDPGILTGTDAGFAQEATLDIQWAGAVAPKASVKMVLSKSTATTDGIDLSTIYTVDNNLADIISISYGSCEQDLSAQDLALYNNLYAQASAQGSSVFAASGDSGAADCELGQSQGKTLSVNGLASSPHGTSVGGTQFNDVANPSTYWETSNSPVQKKSVKSYIPEVPWNESSLMPGGRGLFATGGGVSTIYAKPAWQIAPGVPADGKRDTPDVSLNAAGHTGYLVYYGATSSQLFIFSGTSASAPSFAGIATLLSQKVGQRLGNVNPMLYQLGNIQYSGGAAVFHDVTTGNNTVPGVDGYNAGPGYDLVTGLGSVDAKALVNAWVATPISGIDFVLGASPGAVTIPTGFSASIDLTLNASSSSNQAATLSLGALPSGLTAAFSPAPHGSSGTGLLFTGTRNVLTLSASASAAAGTFPLFVTASSGGVTRNVTLFITVGAPGTPTSVGTESQVPVVLDVFGAGGSHFTSDLVAVNRSAKEVTLQLRYVAVPGTGGEGGPVISRSLGSGRQFYVADVIAFLRANGYALSTDSSAKLGTLFVTFAGLTDSTLVFAGSRTSTPNSNTSVGGAFGTFSSSIVSGNASSTESFVYGLKENGAFRSNLGLAHSPATLDSRAPAAPIDLEIQIFDGDSGLAAGAPVKVTLRVGEFKQINSVLTQGAPGLTNGYVRVRRTVGSDRFIAYGVVNDGASSGGGTSDGSTIVAGGTEGLVPIVLDLPGVTRFRTELSLTNPGSLPAVVRLTYTPSTLLGGSGGGTAITTLAPGQQLLTTDSIAYLRSLGLQIPSDGSKQGGTLLVAGAIAQGRTYNPNPDTKAGGTYGVAYPAIDAAHRAKSSAYVYGLRQDSTVRSNLAIADARVGNGSSVEYTIEIFDADSGSLSPVSTLTKSLNGGQWTQLDGILSSSGIANGYARVRTSIASDFVTYGVVNDGPTPGSRTSDGSYLPMVTGP